MSADAVIPAGEKKTAVSDRAVRQETGRGWDEWFAVLDQAGAADLDHPRIVRLLEAHPEVSHWWRQQITVVYERERGLRAKYEKPDGFAVSRSKTVPVPLAALYRAWVDEERRAAWLPDPRFGLRKATEEKSLRVDWVDGRSRLDVYFYAKGEAKSQVQVQHGKLADADEAEGMKSYWSAALARLVQVLEEEG